MAFSPYNTGNEEGFSYTAHSKTDLCTEIGARL